MYTFIIPKIKDDNMKNSLKIVAFAFLATMIVGCNDSSNSTTTDLVKTGTFVDSPVKGLSYATATQSGFTDASGHFKYKSGEEIEFKLGTLSLGKVKAEALVTPYIVSGDNNTTATNIALLLQNFDANRSNTSMLDVSKIQNTGVYDLSYIDLNWTTAAMETEITGLLATGGFQAYVDDANTSLINATSVKAKMDNALTQYSSAK